MDTIGTGKAGVAASDGEYESNLVSSLVQPSGMKVVIAAGKCTELLNIIQFYLI